MNIPNRALIIKVYWSLKCPVSLHGMCPDYAGVPINQIVVILTPFQPAPYTVYSTCTVYHFISFVA